MGQLFNFLTNRNSLHQIGGIWEYSRQVWWLLRSYFERR